MQECALPFGVDELVEHPAVATIDWFRRRARTKPPLAAGRRLPSVARSSTHDLRTH